MRDWEICKFICRKKDQIKKKKVEWCYWKQNGTLANYHEKYDKSWTCILDFWLIEPAECNLSCVAASDWFKPIPLLALMGKHKSVLFYFLGYCCYLFLLEMTCNYCKNTVWFLVCRRIVVWCNWQTKAPKMVYLWFNSCIFKCNWSSILRQL